MPDEVADRPGHLTNMGRAFPKTAAFSEKYRLGLLSSKDKSLHKYYPRVWAAGWHAAKIRVARGASAAVARADSSRKWPRAPRRGKVIGTDVGTTINEAPCLVLGIWCAACDSIDNDSLAIEWAFSFCNLTSQCILFYSFLVLFLRPSQNLTDARNVLFFPVLTAHSIGDESCQCRFCPVP